MALEPYADHTQINRTTNLDDGIFSVESISEYPQSIDAEQELIENSFTYLAGAMTILDTEPLDGVDNKNGILGYITFVRLLIPIGSC